MGIFSPQVFAELLIQSNQKTHLRWKIKSEKEQVKITKKSQKVIVQSLDPDFFEAFSAEVVKLKKNQNYHGKYKFISPTIPGNPFRLEIDLADKSIELFSFFKKDEGGHILDFWINTDMVSTKEASVSKLPKKMKVAKLNIKKKKRKAIKRGKKAATLLNVKKNKRFHIIDPEAIISKQTGKKFRDFRYGAAFLWDYDALIPPLEKDISLSEKAPNYLYKIKDRKYLEDKKEAHLQLNINFYKKEQWGLMTRSIKLFEQTYGRKNKDLNDFMKAISMIKNTIKNKVRPEYSSKVNEEGDIVPAEDFSRKGVLAAARNLLTNVLDSTKDYQLKKAVLRYLIQYTRNENDYIQALNYAKKLYVDASEIFDDEMIVFSSRVILNSLAHLKQISKIKSFLGNKAVIRVLPKQVGHAYISFVNLSQDNTNQVLADYKINKKAFIKPVHPSILFNTAEAYFRQAEYRKALRIFDEFIDQYSQFTSSSQARLRLALSYDLLGEGYKKVIRLYKDAINKSADLKIRNEAKLRYVGLRVARNKVLTQKDLETVSFIDSISPQDKKAASTDFKELLWLTRLRTYISSKRYGDALAYLTSLPVENLRQIDQRTFNADGSEIILGLIQTAYLKQDHARAVKVWEIYKKKYESKVAKNPYMNFIVSDSFIKLGLFDSYERSMKDLLTLSQKRIRRFPMWVNAHKDIAVKDYIVELRLNKYLKQGDYKGLGGYLEANKSNKNINYKYYKGLVSYKLKKYNDSVISIESLLINPNLKNILTPNQSAKMLEVYLESLYESASPAKFRRNAAALTNDLRRNNRNMYRETVRRSDYLYIESLFSENKVNYKLLSMKTNEYLQDHKKDSYGYRVKYLRGVSLINTNKNSDGESILKELINDKEVPNYLKGLARSELSALELNRRTL